MPLALTRRHALAAALAVAMLPAAGLGQDAPEVAEMALGDADAPVTVIEYASFTCPHCAAFHTEVMPQIKANFIDTGQVRLVYREVYFDRSGLWASMIARCAPADRYFGIVDVLYSTQQQWAVAETPEEVVANLYRIGRQAGLSDDQMNACMQDREFAEALVAEYQKNSAADGIDSTPSFIIDGEKAGNMGYEAFEARLNEALAG
jgi:protein-disulfide isomerase